MSGLLRRLTRRRPATADENVSPTAASSEPAAAPAETPAEPGGQPPVPAEQPTVVLPATSEQPAAPLPAWSVAADQPTAFAAQPAPARDLPAGVDPHDLATAPAASARRGKLRRRLRYLRHVRELLLRDLGGFTYEVHRTAGGTAQEPQRRLTAAKSERIAALDAEVLALESRLGEPHAEALLREPGIGGTCHECGELHASDAHFCSRCGAPLDAKARAQRAAEQPATGSQAVVEPQPASVLWAGGPRPTPEPREEPEAPEPPSAVTSQWLASDRPTTFEPAPKPDGPPAAAPVEPADEPAAAAPVEPPPRRPTSLRRPRRTSPPRPAPSSRTTRPRPRPRPPRRAPSRSARASRASPPSAPPPSREPPSRDPPRPSRRPRPTSLGPRATSRPTGAATRTSRRR